MGRKQPRLRWSGSQAAFSEYLAAANNASAKREKRKAEEAKARKKKRGSGKKYRKWWASYDAYLRSAWWKAKRQQKIDSVGGHCEQCFSSKELQVHHLHYKTVGREKNSDLRVLCRLCHYRSHPEKHQDG